MSIPSPLCRFVILGAALLAPLAAATDFSKYHNYAELTAALKAAVAAHPTLAQIVSIGRTREGRDLWVVEIAAPAATPIDTRPALLVAANFEGDHLIGSELALYMTEALLEAYPTDPAVKQRLDTSAVYVLPRLNPDGAEPAFAPIKALRRTNATPFDADNDGRVDEDGPEDLNQDGFITVMRVKDPKGPYRIHPDHPRLMKRADPAKGEAGGWALYPEGIDNDGDGFINEDGPGGTDLNRNFLHQYPYFAPDAGRFMASEPETRALLEYVLKRRNIAAILTFGESDNLIAAPGRAGTAAPLNLVDFAESANEGARKVGLMPEPEGAATFGRGGGGAGAAGSEAGAAGRGTTSATSAAGRGPTTGRPPSVQPATTINAADTEYFTAIAAKYRDLTGLRSTGFTRAPAGAFYEYGYYQYGVPSFSTPGWGLPEEARPGPAGGTPAEAESARPAAAPAAPEAGRAGPPGSRGGGGSRGTGRGSGRGPGATPEAGREAAPAPEGIDLRLLRWMEREKIDGFVDWTPCKHPTLGDVEIGGFKPYVTVNPPAEKIAALGAGHVKFVLHLLSLFPRIAIASTEVKALGGGLYRLKAEIENQGHLPTSLAQGVVARAVKPVMVQLGVPPEAILTGAEKTNFVPALAGSGTRSSFEWVIKRPPGSSVTLKVMTQKAGVATATLQLPQTPATPGGSTR